MQQTEVTEFSSAGKAKHTEKPGSSLLQLSRPIKAYFQGFPPPPRQTFQFLPQISEKGSLGTFSWAGLSNVLISCISCISGCTHLFWKELWQNVQCNSPDANTVRILLQQSSIEQEKQVALALYKFLPFSWILSPFHSCRRCQAVVCVIEKATFLVFPV